MITIHKHPDHNRTVVFKGLERKHPSDLEELTVTLQYLELPNEGERLFKAIALDSQVIPEIHKRFNEHAALVAIENIYRCLVTSPRFYKMRLCDIQKEMVDNGICSGTELAKLTAIRGGAK